MNQATASKNKGQVSKTATALVTAAAGAVLANPPAGATAEQAVAKADAKVEEAPKAAKVNAGDAAIAACQKVGCTNAQLLKAIWSTRGNVQAQIQGFDFGLSIIKSDLVEILKASPAGDPAPFTLIPKGGKEGGATLIAVPAAKK